MDSKYDGLLKIANELNSSLGVYKGVEPLLDFNKTLDEVYERLNVLEHVNIANMSISQGTERLARLHQNLGVSDFFLKTENINKLFDAVQLSTSSVLNRYNNLDYLNDIITYSPLTSEFLCQTTNYFQNALAQVDWTQNKSVMEILEEVRLQTFGEQANETKDTPKVCVQSESDGKQKVKIEIVMLVLTVIQLLVSVYDVFFSKPPVVNNTYNNTSVINNYYTVETGMDAELLNEMGYRIINENNVMPRVKPDCSSRVTGHLYIGQVVSVSDKWKKWIEINWTDSEGNYCTGWIQNYKVTEFK